jgi:hypothetical protein
MHVLKVNFHNAVTTCREKNYEPCYFDSYYHHYTISMYSFEVMEMEKIEQGCLNWEFSCRIQDYLLEGGHNRIRVGNELENQYPSCLTCAICIIQLTPI